MKKYFTWLILTVLCACVAAQNVQLSENSFQKVSITFTCDSLSSESIVLPEGSFTRISMQDFGISNNPGAPQLPVLAKLLQIPVCDSVAATIVDAKYTDYAASDLGVMHPLYPAQPSVSKSSQKPPFAYTQSIYATDAFYALPLVRVEKAGIRRNYALADVQVSPVQYNPVTQTIRIYHQIDVEFTYVNADMEKTDELKRYSTPPFFLDNKLVLNEMSSTQKENNTVPVKYLIIAHDMFSNNSELSAFVTWKRRLGYLVEVAYTGDESVGGTTASIKSFIQGKYNNATAYDPAPTYLLLIGDVAQVPAFTGQSSSDHVTDLYYATLSGNDNIPDLYYGRLSATTNAHLSNQLEKIMMYEQYTMPDPSYLGNAVLIAGTDENWSSTHANGQINYISNYYINTGNPRYTNVMTHLYNCSSQAATIRNEVSNGAGLVNYTAHGSETGWYDPSFSNSHISSLTNTNKYGLWIGNCCLTGKFDYGECFAEATTRASKKGAMGYIGASNSSYWNEDVYWAVGVRSSINANMSYSSSKLGMYDKLFHTHNEAYSNWVSTIGGIIQGGNLSVQASSSSRKLYYWEIYHCFGDPSVRVYLGLPSQMTVTAGNLDLESASYTAQVAPHAYVALTANGNLLSAAYADANGLVSLPVPESVESTNAELVALAQNYIPYFQTLQVTGNSVTCFRPSALTCTGVTGGTASLQWNENGSASSWVIQYSTDNTFGSHNEITVHHTPSVTLHGLTADTTYFARVKADCGSADGESHWSNVCHFTPTTVDTVEIGSGGTSNQNLPSYSYYKYALSQQIYTPAEIGEAGTIRSIAFYNAGNTESRTYDLYLVHTNKTAFSSNQDWIPVSSANRVFSGTVTMTTGEWTVFTLATPFEYDGSSNLALIADDNTGEYTNAPHMECLVFNSSSNCAIYKYNDNTNYDPAAMTTSGKRLDVKNQVRMNIWRPTPQNTPTYVTLSGDSSVCPGGITTLTASSDVEGTYAWSTGASGSQVSLGAGTYTVTITSTSGEQLAQTVTVTTRPTYDVTDTKTVCESALPYTWNGVSFAEAGTQNVTLTAANGCDSVVTMTLVVNPTYDIADDKTVCKSALPYTWNGVAFTQAGTQSVTLTAANGCDSVMTMTLVVNPTYVVADAKTVCESELPYTWNGVSFTQAGTQNVTLTAANGCDSVVTMTLTVNPTYDVADAKTVCESELPYTWNGVAFTEAGTQNVTLTAANGCDSVVTMTLTVNPTYDVADAKTVCESALPYTWNGVSFTEAGTQSVTLTAANGCDSVVTMTLTVNPTYDVADVKTVCESELPYTWNGVAFTEAGTQSVTLAAANGCDSVVTITLNVNPTYVVADAKTVCESELPYTWNGINFTQAGTQNVTLTAANGCDSVVTMTLTVNPTYDVADAKTVCESALPYTWNGVSFTEAGTQSVTLTAANSCDSVVTMTLTVNPTYDVADAKTVCESELPYTWNGVSFTQAGTQNVTLTATNGCDSVVTMTLVVNPTYDVADVKTVCESELPYTWNGISFTQAGTQSVTLTAANGCDSVVTMTLTVNPTYDVADAKTVCESALPYTWNGVSFTEAGTQNVTLTASNGCDSVVTMTLVVNPTYDVEFTIETTEPCYIWNEVEYCASGDYEQTLQTVHGCDSVVTLHLTIGVGIDDHTRDFQVNVYPNPAHDYVNVHVEGDVAVTAIEIFDAYGHLVRTPQDWRINLTGLANGMYFVRVTTGRGTVTRPFVKW